MKIVAALLAAAAMAVYAPGAWSQSAAAGSDEIEVDRTARASFSLLDHRGRRVTDADFRGRFMLVFFGYTSCPDVCPTDLQMMAAALKTLGGAASGVQPIFVTLDPERDGAEMLGQYVAQFHPRFLGLTGTPDEVALAAQTYGVVYLKVSRTDPVKSTAYTIDHSAFIYLVGPDGRFLAAYPHGIDSRALAADVARHLKGRRP